MHIRRELRARKDDLSLYVRLAGNSGSGNVLIAINGGPGFSSHYMVGLERLAGAAFAVVTYDQRGTGRSDSPALAAPNFSMHKYVEDLEAVRKTVETEAVHLLGHSWGGLIALQYAAIHPLNVRSLVLFGSTPPTWDQTLAGFVRIGRRIMELERAGIIPPGLPRHDLDRERSIFMAYFSDPHFWFSPQDEISSLEFNRTVNQLTWAALKGFNFTADLSMLNLRVLLLEGEDDPIGSDATEAVRRALLNARVESVLLRKCGHFWHECPDRFFSHVRAFLGIPEDPEMT